MDEECQTQENCSNLKITHDQKQVIQDLPEPQANTYNINVDRVTITDGSLKLDKDKQMASNPKKKSNTNSYSKITARKPRTFRKKLAPRYADRIAHEDKVNSYLHEIDIDYYRLRLTLIFLITIRKNGKSSSMQKTVGPLSFYHLIPGPFSLAALLINYFIHTFQNFMSSPNAFLQGRLDDHMMIEGTSASGLSSPLTNELLQTTKKYQFAATRARKQSGSNY